MGRGLHGKDWWGIGIGSLWQLVEGLLPSTTATAAETDTMFFFVSKFWTLAGITGMSREDSIEPIASSCEWLRTQRLRFLHHCSSVATYLVFTWELGHRMLQSYAPWLTPGEAFTDRCARGVTTSSYIHAIEIVKYAYFRRSAGLTPSLWVMMLCQH